MSKKSGKGAELLVESVLDLNASNIWSVDEYQIASMWESEKLHEGFRTSEEKMLNVIRLAFEVVHYNPTDPREREKYENGEWAVFSRVVEKKGCVAIRPRQIKRITDLSYENVKHISAAALLELIDRNFGGGWDSIPLAIRDIIESGFDVSTTQLPTSRIHAKGGTLERKTEAGFEVLEIVKGTWTEAIFAKKKEPMDALNYDGDQQFDENGNLIVDEDAEIIDDSEEEAESDGSGYGDDDTYYSSYAEEAEMKPEEEEGLPIEEEE